MSDANEPKTGTIFLFGAGASVDAGIPDTFAFVTEFEKYINQQHPDYSKLLNNIVKIRRRFNQRIYGEEQNKVDIEQLLDTIRRLIERENDPLLDFYDEKKFSLDVEQNKFTELKNLLENFIREKVIIDDETKLEYLKELWNFKKPIEIYSTNYDTCIEQLSHIRHMRYTDGFDVYWNAENFERDFDVKHYKMHGSVIWYQSLKTKECVKIPVHGFLEGKSIELKLIYGEDVEPLVIYPAQKAEYVEPLTDLQLRFKNRLINAETKFLVVVGYSFRDDYIIHMLWDAARVNKNLHVVLISPNAQEIFENKLKFINKETSDTSRIDGRVLCLPYPFSTVISRLRNQYLDRLGQILSGYQTCLEVERSGRGEPPWKNLVSLCIEAEFLTKCEDALKKTNKDWQDLQFGPHSELLLLGFKALLHSVICKDGLENNWLKRINDTFRRFSAEKLKLIDQRRELVFLGFDVEGNTLNLADFLKDWINPLLEERKKIGKMLTPKYADKLSKIEHDLNRLGELYEYLDKLSKGVNWRSYEKLENDSDETKAIIDQFKTFILTRQIYANKINNGIVEIEQNRLRRIFGNESFEFKLQ